MMATIRLLQKPVSIPRIQLSGCDIINAASVQLTVPSLKSANRLSPASNEIHLGNFALWNSIVIIDYRRRLLTIAAKDATYSHDDIANKEQTSFSWNLNDSRHNVDAPLLYGRVDAHQSLIIFDSGTSGVVGLNPQFFSILQSNKRNLPSFTQVRVDFMGGSETKKMVPSISFIFDQHKLSGSPVTVTGRAVVMNKTCGTASAVMGTDMFRNYIITLDYPRRIITFSHQR